MQWEEQIGSNSDMSGDDFDFTYDAAMNKERNRVIFGCPNCDAAMDLIHLESEMWIHNRYYNENELISRLFQKQLHRFTRFNLLVKYDGAIISPQDKFSPVPIIMADLCISRLEKTRE